MAGNPLYEFFIQPILQNGWFNPQNTLLWAVLLILGVFLVYYKILKPLKIDIDRNFFYALLPFIFFAAWTRVLRDFAYAGAKATASAAGNLAVFESDLVFQYSSVHDFAYLHILNFIPIQQFSDFYAWIVAFFPTPGSYVITFLFAFIALIISLVLRKFMKIQYWKTMAIIGLIGLAVSIYLLPLVTFTPLLLILTITVIWVLLFFVVYRISRIGWFKKQNITHLFSPINQGILSVHLFDAAATFTALTFFGYVEQHFLTRDILFPVFGYVSFFLLKVVVVLPVLWIIDRYGEPGNFNNFLKIVIIILGLAPALRDTIRLMVGV